MKLTNKWIALILAIGMVCALCIGCTKPNTDNPSSKPSGTPSGNTTQSQTTAEPETEPPLTKYGNYTTEGAAKTLEEIFAKEIKETDNTFATGSSYSDEKLANIHKIADYLANYQKYVDEYDAQDKLDELYAETGFTLDLGFGAQMIKQYIDMTGETLDYSDRMLDLLEHPKVIAAQNTTVNAAMKAAENLVKSGQSGININQSTPMSFSSLRSSDGTIYFALGSYHTMADLTDVQRTGDTLTATLHFRIVDYYDWSINGTEPEFTTYLAKLDDSYRTLIGSMMDMETLEGFCQKDMAQLHLAGLAQNYLAHGTITYQITWTVGQTFDQATVQQQ